eukprot:gene16553-5895_t
MPRPELACYLGQVCGTWRAILSEEEDWVAVHTEDDDPLGRGRQEKRDLPSDEGVSRLIDELEGFQFQANSGIMSYCGSPGAHIIALLFQAETDPQLAVGKEAFELAARRFPFFMFPIASVTPHLTDDEIKANYGFLNLAGQSLQGRVMWRPPRHLRPLIRHLEVQNNFISPAGGVSLLEAMCIRDEGGEGVVIHHLDLSGNELGHKAAHLPREAETVSIIRRELRARAGADASPPREKRDGAPPAPVPLKPAEGWGEARGSGRVLRGLLDGQNAPKCLQVLRLRNNKLGDLDVQWIAQGLHENRDLIELDLSYNCLGPQGIPDTVREPERRRAATARRGGACHQAGSDASPPHPHSRRQPPTQRRRGVLSTHPAAILARRPIRASTAASRSAHAAQPAAQRSRVDRRVQLRLSHRGACGRRAPRPRWPGVVAAADGGGPPRPGGSTCCTYASCGGAGAELGEEEDEEEFNVIFNVSATGKCPPLPTATGDFSLDVGIPGATTEDDCSELARGFESVARRELPKVTF